MPVERKGEDFLRPDDVEDGEVLVVTAKPELVDTQWKNKDGTPKTRYRISIKLPDGQEKPVTLNATSSNALLEGFGPNEDGWLNRKIIVEKRYQKVRGEDKYVLYFKPSGEPLKKQATLGAEPTGKKLTLEEALEKVKEWPEDLAMSFIDHLRSTGRLQEGPH